MFGAFLFDFVCRRQMEAAMQNKNNQNQRTHPNRRPHLASIASPLTSPGREYEYNDNDDKQNCWQKRMCLGYPKTCISMI